MATAGRSAGTAVIENIAPWDWVQTTTGWARWADFCRGGGGQSELLLGLQELLVKVKRQESRDAKGKAKGKGKKNKETNDSSTTTSSEGANKKGKGQGSNISNDADLLQALEHIVKEARKDPSTLLDNVQAVVQRAVAGYGQGRAARRMRAKLHSQGNEHEGGGHEQNPKSVAPDFCRPVGEEAHGDSWTIVRSKKPTKAPVEQWTLDPLVGGVIGYGIAKKRLSDGIALSAHLVIACEQSELDSLQALARTHELKDKVAVICRFTPDTDTEAKTVQLPSIGPRGQKQVRSWPIVPLGGGGGPEIKHKAVLKSSFTVPDRQLITLRIQVPKEFKDTEAWASFCNKPNEHTKNALGPFHAFGTWQKLQAGEHGHREMVLECYGKVATADKNAVLAKSGTDGIFVAELAKDAVKPVVDWLPAGETVGPAYLHMAQRKALSLKTSLAYRRGGGASLGLRVAPDQVGDRACTWRARHVPRDWAEEDLIGALSAAGFSECEVLAPGRAQVPWLLRAKLKGDGGQPALAIQVGKHIVDMERATAKRKLVNVEATRLTPGSTRKVLSTAPGTNKAPATGTTSGGTPANGKGKGPAKGNQQGSDDGIDPRGRPAQADGGAQARSRSPKGHTEEWFEVRECGGSGNCFYNAIGAHYAAYRDNFQWPDACKLAKTRGATLKAEIADYIREKPDTFKAFWLPPPEPATETEKENLEQMEGGTPPQTWDEYLQALDRPGRWADDLAFRATTKRMNCRIILVVGDVLKPSQVIAYGKPIQFKDDRQQQVIPLLYKDKHYQLITPKSGKSLPDEWLNLPAGGHTTVGYFVRQGAYEMAPVTMWFTGGGKCTNGKKKPNGFREQGLASAAPPNMVLGGPRRHKLNGKQSIPGASSSGKSSAALELGDLPDVPVDCALAALRAETASDRLSIPAVLDEIVKLGGKVESYPWLNKSVAKASHQRSMRSALKLLKEVTEIQRHTGHDFAQIPRKVCIKEPRVRGSWGCRKCCEIHAHLSTLRFAADNGHLEPCRGHADRPQHLRSKGFRKAWEVKINRSAISSVLSLTREEKALLRTHGNKLQQKLGAPRPRTAVRKLFLAASKDVQQKRRDRAASSSPTSPPCVPRPVAGHTKHPYCTDIPMTFDEETETWTWKCSRCEVEFHGKEAHKLQDEGRRHVAKHHAQVVVSSPVFKHRGKLCWPCTVCKSKVTADTKARLKDRRRWHIESYHPDCDVSQFLTLGGKPGGSQRPGPKRVKALLDAAKERLVEENIEPHPGPSIRGDASRPRPKRVKALLDAAKERLVEENIEPNPGPSVRGGA
ncbi:unnamed protein product, partial [Symbiodinium sp. CCMP2456]